MFSRTRKKEESKMQGAEWWIHNQGTDLEFAECSVCGHEVEPIYASIHAENGNGFYPCVCPVCINPIVCEKRAEDVE